MKIRTKTAVITGLTFLLLFGILFTISKTILLHGFEQLDTNEAIKESKRARAILTYRLSLLDNKIIDWAAWDDTYNFMKGQNPDYIENNLQNSTFEDLDVDLMLFMDIAGNILYGKQYIVDEMKETQVPASLLKYLKEGALQLKNPKVDSRLNGILTTDKGPVMVSGYSIVTNGHGGPAMGTLIFGVYLNKNEINNISDILQLPVEARDFDSAKLPEDYESARKAYYSRETPFARTISGNRIAGYAFVKDLFGDPIMILRVTLPREMFSKGLSTIRYNFVFVFTITLLVFLTFLVLLEKTVMLRMARLSSRMSEIGESSDLTERVPVDGKDEIGCLAVAINDTLSALEFSQNSLKAERYLLSAVLDTVDAIVVVTDHEGNIIHVNRAFEKLFGYSPDDAANNFLWNFIPTQEERDAFVDSLQLLVKNGESKQVTIHFSTKSGSLRTAEWSNTTIKDEHGNIEFIVGTGIDITERDKAIERLKQSEQNYRTLIESAPDTVFALTRDAKYISINRIGASRLGAKVEDLIGKRVTEIFPREISDWMLSQLEEVFSTGKQIGPLRRETPMPHGTEWLETVLAPVKDSDESISYVIGFVRNMTAQVKAEENRKALEQQLFQAQKMEAVGTLAGGIAHDFNNMLAVIMGNAQLAELDIPKGTPGHREFSEIMKAVERAKDLTMKLLTFARKEKLNVQTVMINDILSDLVLILKRSIPKRIEIKTVLKEGLRPVNADINQLQQALLNICNNACDSMTAGGVLTIESNSAEAAQDGTPGEGNKTGPFCHIRISDTGSGIMPEVLPRIFDPFFTTKERGKGTGLGLSITLGIIKNHDGGIRVDSNEGAGAVFNIFLPFSNEKVRAEIMSINESDLPRGSETILLVDDEAPVLNVAKRLLKKAGYNPITADNAAAALFTFKKHKSEIALVVLDMIMPDTDARELYTALREIDPGVKTILASGHSIEGQAGELLADGILGFVQKPYSMGELCKAIRQAIDGST